MLRKKWAKSQTKAQKRSKDDFFFNLGDLTTHTGEREIGAISRRFTDNPGELACM